jgi:spore germination protein KA
LSFNLTNDLEKNIEMIKNECHQTSDLNCRKIEINGHKIAFLTFEGMTSSVVMSSMIIGPLNELKASESSKPQDLFDFINNKTIMGMESANIVDSDALFKVLMSGFLIIIIDGINIATSFGVQGFAFRSVSEPTSEVNVRGGQEGFIEPIRMNMSLVRRRFKSPDLKMEMITMGDKTKTDVCLVYLFGVVSPQMVDDIKNKLKAIKIDVVLESGYLQGFLEGKPFSIFSEVGITQRPDSFCAKISEGRIGIIVDGTPYCLIVPYLFSENFQSFDDYCHKAYFASFVRIIKYLALIFTVLLPGVYVAIATFHPELFPNSLLLNVATAEEITPFPIVFEAFIIHFIYEIMKEAGLRLPRQIGFAVSIVGGLVIGDAAVRAGIIGAPMVMVVALTAISSFVVPSIYEPISILRFVFIILGGTLGLYGISLGVVSVLINICSLSSYGVPYMAPISPYSKSAAKDTFIRASWKSLIKSRANINELNGVNQNDKND